jgi:uncharacterized membrane protein
MAPKQLERDGHGNIKHEHVKPRLTLGQRSADLMTRWVGSWKFISTLFVIMAIWMSINLYEYIVRPWDPYPFILLNFVLSCLAAVQAPIILMSQNRQTEKDRKMAEYDYAVNRRAEREVANMQTDLDEIKSLIRGLNKK